MPKLFRPAKTGSRVPLTDTESFQEAVVGATLPSATTGEDLLARVAGLEETFEKAEGRPPTDHDDEFWIAANRLIDAYDGRNG